MNQDNKPNNKTMNSMGKPAPVRPQKDEVNQKQSPSTAERGSQPTKKVPHS